MADTENKEEMTNQSETPEVTEKKDLATAGKIRSTMAKFLWIPAIIFFALAVMLLYFFSQNLLTVFDYSLNEKTLENIVRNIQDLFMQSTAEIILPVVFFIIIAAIFSVFSIINFIRTIILLVGIFGLFGKKDAKTKIKKFGKLSRNILASYGLYFELILLARMGDFHLDKGGLWVIIISCVLYFVIAVLWQLLSIENENAFDWKKECFNFVRVLLRPTLAILLAFYAITPWLKQIIETVAVATNSGTNFDNSMIIPISTASICGIATAIILALLVRKTLTNGAVWKKGKESSADNTLFIGAIIYLVFALINAVGASIGGVLVGGGFDSAVFMAHLKELIIPILLFLSIISLTKIAAPKKKEED